MSCSCPDWEVPCKHLAATFYLLGERFDADPFEILAWRGRDRATLLARLRTLRGTEPVGAAAEDGTDGVGGGGGSVTSAVGAMAALEDLDEPVGAAAPERFWNSPVPLGRRPSTLPVPVDLLLRQLPPPAASLGGAVLIDRLRPAYERFADTTDEPRRR